MNKTLFTAIIGGYDTLKEPEVITPGWNYVCFSDRPQASKVWDVKLIVPKWGSILSSREIKIRHHLYLPSGVSVWADASMTVRGNLDELLERYHHCAFSISRHPDRDCLYEEARACIALGKDNADVINSQVYGYRLDGFPKRAGLVASGVIIRSSPHITFENAWWEEVRIKSCRDQLSFPVIARSTGLDYQVMPFEELMKNFFLWHDDHPKPIATPPTSVSDPASH